MHFYVSRYEALNQRWHCMVPRSTHQLLQWWNNQHDPSWTDGQYYNFREHQKDACQENSCGVQMLKEQQWRDPPQGTYNYASVIGMLQYPTGHSRPSIAVAKAPSVCCTLTISDIALQRIGLHLKGTKNLGLINLDKSKKSILTITWMLTLQACGDTKTNKIWAVQKVGQHYLSSSSKDVLLFGSPNCRLTLPRFTMENKYSALSMSMRDVLPLKVLTKAMWYYQVLNKSAWSNSRQQFNRGSSNYYVCCNIAWRQQCMYESG